MKRHQQYPYLLTPLSIAGIYLLISALWILLSDYAIFLITDNLRTASWLQTVKGWFFVVSSTLLLYFLIRKAIVALEHVLRESEDDKQHLRSVFDASQDGLITLDKEERITFISASAAAIFGIFGDPAGRLSLDSLIAPASAEAFREVLKKELDSILTQSPLSLSMHVEARRASGACFPAEMRLSGGHRLGEPFVLCCIRDLSEKRHAEQEHRLLLLAMEQAKEGIVIGDMHNHVQYMNHSMTDFVKRRACSDETFIRVICGECKDSALCWQDVCQYASQGLAWTCPNLSRRNEVTDDAWDITVFPIAEEGSDTIQLVGMVRDVSEQQKLEKKLREAQRMESVGLLAGGIAHDFNNLLTAILGYTEMAIEDLPKDSQTRLDLEQVVVAGQRAKDLVFQILTFSRNVEQKMVPVALRPLVKEALKLLRATLPSTISIHEELGGDDAMVMGDLTRLHQVLMNLCTNAFHAMEENGGELSVALHRVTAEAPPERRLPGLNPGTYVRLTVRDTGHGMDRATIDRIFDPFFTTKAENKGTGLGLSVVHGIVQSHEGYITVYSEPGKGTVFNVFLPAIDAESETPPAVEEALPRGTERVLVVDDEELLANLARMGLGSLGYEATSFTSPEQALASLSANPSHFDLILTDQTMPGRTGIQLARDARAIRPDIPVVLFSGFVDQDIINRAKSSGIVAVLRKPARLRELAKTIRDALDNARPS